MLELKKAGEDVENRGRPARGRSSRSAASILLLGVAGLLEPREWVCVVTWLPAVRPEARRMDQARAGSGNPGRSSALLGTRKFLRGPDGERGPAQPDEKGKEKNGGNHGVTP